MKKLFSSLLAAVMLVSLCTSAFAADHVDKYVVGHVLTEEETAEFWREHNTSLAAELPLSSTVRLPVNVDGHQGNGCGYFTAESENICFVITNAPGAESYNVYLADSHNNAVSEYYRKVPINNPVAFRDLIIGEEYHFVVSSNDLSKACTANYEVY